MGCRTSGRLLALAVSVSVAIPGSALAWLHSVDGDAVEPTDRAFAVAVDGAGAVIAVGAVEGVGEQDFFATKLDPATGAAIWRRQIDGAASQSDTASFVAVDTSDDVLLAGTTETSPLETDFLAIKLDGATGGEVWRLQIDASASAVSDGADGLLVRGSGETIAVDPTFLVSRVDGVTGLEIWRREIDGTAVDTDRATTAHLDGSGGLIAAGTLSNVGTSDDFFVVKLDAGTGLEQWRAELDGGNGAADAALGVAIDATGDVFVCGRLDRPATGPDFAVLKFDGATGAEEWRRVVSGTGTGDEVATAVVLDASGDAFVAGLLDDAGAGRGIVVLKVDGSTGAEIWRREIDGSALGGSSDGGARLRFDSAGALFVGGVLENAGTAEDVFVSKLDPATGVELWRAEISGSSADRDGLASLTIDDSDDVVLSGFVDEIGTDRDLLVAKLDGTTGAEVWRHVRAGTFEDDFFSANDQARAVRLLAGGDVVVVGDLENEDSNHDFTVARIDGTNGSLGAMDGRILTFRDPSSPDKRKLKFQIKDALVATPWPGSPNDPRTAGATVRIANPTRLEEATLVIPGGAGWKGLGKPAGAEGYKYRAPKGVGPCTTIVAKPEHSLRAVCKAKAGPLPFSLDEASQGSLAVSARFGVAPPQCAVFGGLVVRDEPGNFKAKSATAEGSCP